MFEDRFSRAIRAIVRELMADVDYLALYPATIEAVHADSSLDLKPLSPKMPPGGWRKVPLRVWLPGAVVRCKVGGRVLVGFEAGDPSRPYASLFDGAALELSEVVPGGLPAARRGDMVASGAKESPGTLCNLVLLAPTPIDTPSGPGTIPMGATLAGQIIFPTYLPGQIVTGQPKVLT